MPWVTINGEQKKVACGPCIRGHRSTSCNHKDRLLLEVRKPGRPLSSCPHLGGNCSCERLVINYTIPRSSECACPGNGEDPAPVAEVVSSTIGPLPGASSRVQKPKRKSVSASRNPAALEKAIKAAEEAEQKITTEPPKSCCSQKQPPATTGSSATSPVPTTEGSSPSSHDDGPTPSDSTAGACCKPNTEVEARPLNIQLETRKQNTGYASSAQVQGWKHMTIDGASEPKTIIEEPTKIKSSCCGGGNPAKNEALAGQPDHRSALSTPNGFHSHPQKQAPNGVHSRIQLAQQSFGQSQPYPVYGGQHQFNNPVQGHSFSNAPSNGINYATNGAPSGQYASYYPFALGSQPPNGFQNNLPDFMHNCTCGDACACLGCAVHPRNETTLRHLQDVANFMIQDPFYAGPSSPPYNNDRIQYQPAYQLPGSTSANAERTWAASKVGQPYQQQPTFKHPGATYPQDVNGSSFWHRSNGSSAGSVHATPSSELQQFSFQEPRNGAQRENQNFQASQFSYQQASSYESSSIHNAQFATPEPAPSTTAAETPTLSPSSFFWQQVELPGCDDESGACRCGDGCQCVGCLTHGGHDGVQLPQPNGDLSSGFSPPVEQVRMNSIDIALDTKPGG